MYETKLRRESILALRMARQGFTAPVGQADYPALYRDLQPGQTVYYNGFGEPPTLSFRTDFDDKPYNRRRQERHELLKGRFAGGNIGWIIPEDLELFAALYRKPLTAPNEAQMRLLELLEREGPMNIQQMKEETGLLVRTITPALHRLQEAFLLYEDQSDGEWDREWYRFAEMFPDADTERYTRREALRILLPRFAYRMVCFDTSMAKSCWRLPEKEIGAAVQSLAEDKVLCLTQHGWMLAADAALRDADTPAMPRFVRALHRNDFLYKAYEAELKAQFGARLAALPYDHEILQALLIDGEFAGLTVGHFRHGPYDLCDVLCDHPDAAARREEILAAVRAVNFGKTPQRFMGIPRTGG